mgnify:CR=1 FL=1
MPNREFTETEKKRAMMFFTTLLDRSLVGNGVNPFQDLDWDATVEKGIEALLKMKQKDSFKFFSEEK